MLFFIAARAGTLKGAMRPGRLLCSILLASVCSLSGCAQALLGDDEYVPDDGAGASGGGGNGNRTDPTACDSGLAVCGASCVNLESDPAHCGRCDRACGSSCSQGLCEPSVVVADVAAPQDVTLDDTHVYWTTANGTVQRAPKSGGAVETIAEEQDSPATLLVDDKYVYWINGGTGAVMRQKKEKKGNNKPKQLSKGTGARSLAQDAASIYYSRKIKKGDIRVVPKGEDDGPTSIALGEQPLPAHLHVRGATLFWSGYADADDDMNGNSVPDGDERLIGGYVRSMLRDGESLITLAAGEGDISALTLLGDVPVWADRTHERIRAYSPDEGGAITLVPGQDVRGLTSDEGAIYWSTAGGNVKSRTAQGQLLLLALDIPDAGPLAVDATDVYILRTGPNGAILRVAK